MSIRDFMHREKTPPLLTDQQIRQRVRGVVMVHCFLSGERWDEPKASALAELDQVIREQGTVAAILWANEREATLRAARREAGRPEYFPNGLQGDLYKQFCKALGGNVNPVKGGRTPTGLRRTLEAAERGEKVTIDPPKVSMLTWVVDLDLIVPPRQKDVPIAMKLMRQPWGTGPDPLRPPKPKESDQ